MVQMRKVNPSHGKYEDGKSGSCEAYPVKCQFWYKQASPTQAHTPTGQSGPWLMVHFQQIFVILMYFPLCIFIPSVVWDVKSHKRHFSARIDRNDRGWFEGGSC